MVSKSSLFLNYLKFYIIYKNDITNLIKNI